VAVWPACGEEQARLREEMTDSLPVFGRPAPSKPAATSRHKDLRYASEILSRRVRASSPYRRLKLALDYWCALWFWPLEKADQLPSREEWLFDLELVLLGGVIDRAGTGESQLPLFPSMAKEEAEALVRRVGMVNVETSALRKRPLRTADELAENNAFCTGSRVRRHLRLPGRFRPGAREPAMDQGGMDGRGRSGRLVAPLRLPELQRDQMARLREELLVDEALRKRYFGAYEEAAGQQNFLNALCNYPELHGLQSNLFKCFSSRRVEDRERTGSPPSSTRGVYDDPNGGALRRDSIPASGTISSSRTN
jgi:hypothetical protein